jgi:hypothetical protein
VTAGDSVPLDVDVETTGGSAADSVTVEATLGGKRLASRRLRLSGGSGRGRLVLASTAIGPGEHVLRIALVGTNDAEPRTDVRLHDCGGADARVVLLADPADWIVASYIAPREVAQLPVRGSPHDPQHWRSMADSGRSEETVRQRRGGLIC